MAASGASTKPNIVFFLIDNSGWGDYGCYGGTTPTPRIDSLAQDGIQFNNYAVESQCTPTRSAIMTGRQSVRSGTYKVPMPGQGPAGLSPWEYSIAKLLSDAGYATSAWGKWHCGETDDRLPTSFGFDEWWGYRNSADECGYTSYATFRALAKAAGLESPKLWECKQGGTPKATGELDVKVRPFLDEMIVQRAVDYIKDKAGDSKPFFTYIATSHFHPPEAVHPDFDQTDPSRLGEYADVTAEIDHRVGQVLDAIDEAGIAENTLVVFSADNGPGLMTFATGGSAGPFRGGFFDPPFEGSYRVPAIVRWSGTIGPKASSEELLTCHDWLPTLAGIAGASERVPTDRPIDGVDASDFLLGKSPTSPRTHHLFFGPDGSLMSCKWGDVKMILRYSEGPSMPIVQPQFPLFYDLGSDPGEHLNLFETKLDQMWMLLPCMKAIVEFKESEAAYPNIEPGENFRGYSQVKAGVVKKVIEEKPKIEDAKDKIGNAIHSGPVRRAIKREGQPA